MAALTPRDSRKQSLYFSDADLRSMRAEAARLQRSLSWVLQRAWKLARQQLRAYPSSPMHDPDKPPAARVTKPAGVSRDKRLARGTPPPEKPTKVEADWLRYLAKERQRRRAEARAERPAKPAPRPPQPPPSEPARPQAPHAGTPVSRAWQAHLLDRHGPQP